MKKVLSFAFITAIFLFGCSADGFFEDPEHITWGKMCKVGEQCNEVQAKTQCDIMGGILVTRSQCLPPPDETNYE